VDEAAESVAAVNAAGVAIDQPEPLSRVRRGEVTRPVRSMAVVVVGVDAEHALEVAAVHDQEPVETLSADGADEALGDCVRSWGSHRRLDDADGFAGENSVEVAGELAVAVADQEAEPPVLILERPGELARL
jgi:hypothetical protein